jgi:hypothetical protein
VKPFAMCLGLLAVAPLAACGSSNQPRPTVRVLAPRTITAATASTTAAAATTATAPQPPPPPPHPRLLTAATQAGPTPFVPAVSWRGRTAVWIARTGSGVSLLSFDQRLVEVHLHSGTTDAGTLDWRYGPSIGGGELKGVVAAFNGGFRLSTGAGGFEAYGHVGYPLRVGAGSIVTYSDGTTDVGSWQQGVPAAGRRVVSVRQNLTLLIDHGVPASTVGCLTCWGATLGGVVDPARSALGVTADGRLIWAGGEHLTVTALADALQAARVERAVELDINPEWVAAYLYAHHSASGPVQPVPALAAQTGIPGEYLSPWSRDFFAVAVR